MARRKYETLPDGIDQPSTAGEVRHGAWMIDPETGEWAKVKEFRGPAFSCTGFGGKPNTKVTISLWRFGVREVDPETPVTVRVRPQPLPPQNSCAFGC